MIDDLSTLSYLLWTINFNVAVCVNWNTLNTGEGGCPGDEALKILMCPLVIVACVLMRSSANPVASRSPLLNNHAHQIATLPVHWQSRSLIRGLQILDWECQNSGLWTTELGLRQGNLEQSAHGNGFRLCDSLATYFLMYL